MCEKEAAEWAEKKENYSKSTPLKFGDALDAYISSRENVLSPRTIMDYRLMRNKYVQSLIDVDIREISQEQIQKAINLESLKLSPKTVRNIHGLISAVLKVYRPEFALNTALPKRKHVELYIPTDGEVKKLLETVKDTDMELPILSAAFGPMRRGEICALESSDITGNIVHVSKNMVENEQGDWIIKTPKSYAGDRYIDYPEFVAEKWRGMSGRIVLLTPKNITHKLSIVCATQGCRISASMISGIIQHPYNMPSGFQTVTSCNAVARGMMVL